MWRLNHDDIAAHALICIILKNKKSMELASKHAEQRRRCAANFLADLPCALDSLLGATPTIDGTENDDVEQRIGLYANQMLYEPAPGRQFSAIQSLLRLKETVGASEQNEYSVPIVLSSKQDDLPERVCNFEAITVDGDKTKALKQHASASMSAYLQMGKLTVSNRLFVLIM